MRKLLTALLVLPFLLGANAGTGAPGSGGEAATASHGLSSLTAAVAQPPLPAQLTTAGLATGSILLGTGSPTDWRAPRTGRPGSDLLHGHVNTCCTWTRLAVLRERELRFRDTVERAHAGRPDTYGNPPPASLT